MMSPEELRFLDRAVQAGHEALRDWYSSWLFGSTAVVIVGCCMEIPEVIDKLWDKLIPRGKKRAVKVLSTTGLFLLIFGIAGELVFEGRSGRAEGILQTLNEILLSDAQLKIAEANERAGDAKDSAVIAAKAASLAGKQAATAVANAKAVDEKATKLVADVKDADDQLTIVEGKRKKLEESLVNLAVCTAPRVIPQWISSGRSYSDPLSSLKGFTIHIIVLPDPESRRAAWNLDAAFSDAGAAVTLSLSGPQEGLLDGVWVYRYSFASASNEDSAHAGSASSIANHEAVPKSKEAADRIVSFLGSYNWQARNVEGSVSMQDVTAKGLRIEVGLYPPTEEITPPAMAGLGEEFARMQENNEIARKAGRRSRFEARINDMPQAEAAQEAIYEEQSIKRMDDAERRIQAQNERDNIQPCKAVDAH